MIIISSNFSTFLVIFTNIILVQFLTFLVDQYDNNSKLGNYDKQIFIHFLFYYFKDIFVIFMSYFKTFLPFLCHFCIFFLDNDDTTTTVDCISGQSGPPGNRDISQWPGLLIQNMVHRPSLYILLLFYNFVMRLIFVFSTIKYLKNKLRNSMTNDNLEAFILMFIEKSIHSILMELDNDIIINKLGTKKDMLHIENETENNIRRHNNM
ncbi:hypothetical protein AGLY_008790 [Aphis glycines]|uniref:Uncharacterized protein n=1 Tax=Aphis glycines TaxID=307491 RepID=A0A6G0TKV4_APHGL|nr:hypothetical protein AGLY_008790 [Aphis glycines]